MPVTKQASASAPQAAPAAPTTMQLELALYQRYVLQNTLYEKGVVYTFTIAQATRLLQRTGETGLPIFKMYAPAPKKAVKNKEGKPTMDMTSADLPPNAVQEDGIKIGDLSELEEDGILVDQEDEDAVTV